VGRLLGRYWVLVFVSTFLFLSSSTAQEASNEKIFFHAKVFTADPQNPYADAVAIRGDQIIAVGTLPEVMKSVSANAQRIDLEGKTLFPGFIDSHSHSIDGGLGLIAADASEKVESLSQLPPFVAEAKKSGRGMHGDILEILGLTPPGPIVPCSTAPASPPNISRNLTLTSAPTTASINKASLMVFWLTPALKKSNLSSLSPRPTNC
jgi:Amidohydrolase family